MRHWWLKRPQAKRTTLGKFVRAWQSSEFSDSTEKLVVFRWGPIMVAFPGEREAWRT